MLTVLMIAALAAGSQTEAQTVSEWNVALELEMSQFKGFWQHVTLIGVMATGVFLRVIRRG